MPAPLAQPTICIALAGHLERSRRRFRACVRGADCQRKFRKRTRRRPAVARKSPASARRIFSTGSGTPITPVEQTNNSFGAQPMRLAASATVRCAAASPSWPVAQLALPALTTTPRMRPFEARRCSLGNDVPGGDHQILREYRRSRRRNIAETARDRARLFSSGRKPLPRSEILVAVRLRRGRASSRGRPLH